MSSSTSHGRRLDSLETARRATERSARRSTSSGLTVPGIIEFVTSPNYMDRPLLYPRQATLLKIMSCQHELLTHYDLSVIADWEAGFELTEHGSGARFEGRRGLAPGTVERMRACRAEGREGFREIVLVMGRRAGKGHLSAIMTCYLLWRTLALGDPQAFFGIEPTKQLLVMTMAADRVQASSTVHRDVVEMVETAPCFAPFLGAKASGLRLRTPADIERDPSSPGSIKIEARATTASSGRGSAGIGFIFDEMAWAPGDGQARGADEVYRGTAPSLAQFPRFSMTILASSPASQTGEFHGAYRRALQAEHGAPADLSAIAVQLPSWDPYLDWEMTRDGLAMWPAGPTFAPIDGPVIDPDSAAVRAARANRDTYLVEYEAQWRASTAAYLDRDLVDRMFAPYRGLPLHHQTIGVPGRAYHMHCDPSVSGANFGLAIGHLDGDTETGHVVFDYMHSYQPREFPDGRIDYEFVQDQVWGRIEQFKPMRVTFDQYSSEQMIQVLTKRARLAGLGTAIGARPATRSQNWMDAERFKTLLGQDRIHAPAHELAHNELIFLEVNGYTVDHPATGPITTSDLADCLFNVTATLMDGSAMVHQQLSAAEIRATYGTRPPGFDAFRPGTRLGRPRNPARGRTL